MKKIGNILAIESSCDETAVAVMQNGRKILSNEVISQIDMHSLYGGVVPEIASRKHIEVIEGLAERAIERSGITLSDIDAVAVTFAPGLIGALLVGLNFAKAASFALQVPLIPVHHIRGHVAANYIAFPELEPPFACLVASGGHTVILGVDTYTDYRIIGSSRDDAAGEAFDKVARVLGLGYPGGSKIDELSVGGDPEKYSLPRSKIAGSKYDMSFSGLKTSAINLIHNSRQKGEGLDLHSFSASFASTVSGTVVPRVIEACKEFGYSKLSAAGGVAANSTIRNDLKRSADDAGLKLYLPPLWLCGDNAAMIGCQGYYEYLKGVEAGMELNAFATLDSDYTAIDIV